MRSLVLAPVFGAVLMLSACGTDPGDRAVSGGLLGAGAGAAIGAIAGNAGAGAAIGAVAGAATGALTDPCTLNLGNPVWRDHGGRAAYERRCGHPPPGWFFTKPAPTRGPARHCDAVPALHRAHAMPIMGA